MDSLFYLNSILLGFGLAAGAVSVSMANGLAEPRMSRKKNLIIAGCFAFFQFLMPMIGWFFVHTILEMFQSFERFIPWIALILLLYIGGKMIYEARFASETEAVPARLTGTALLLQGIATSIDALSAGFTIAEYRLFPASVRCLIIAAVTFLLSFGGVRIGRTAGNAIGKRAAVFGGIILIMIGLEIWFKGVFSV